MEKVLVNVGNITRVTPPSKTCYDIEPLLQIYKKMLLLASN
jgi:hypothetical protein